jgi:hypothetical protein
MITATILTILGLLLLIVLWMMVRKPGHAKLQAGASRPQITQSGDVHPSEARKGDVVSIHGAAEDFSDVDFTVDRRGYFEAQNRRWIDLSGEFRGNRVYLEVQPKPSTEVMGFLDPRRLTLADVPLAEEQLVLLDSRQDPNATIAYEGKNWNYDSSREVGYFENEQGEGEGVYRWLFREQNGKRLLCVEKWEGEPFEVRIVRHLNTRDITVYRAS